MTSVEFDDNGFVVDAEILAQAFGIAPSEVQGLIRSQAMTSRCEKGVDEDEGRWRLTFIYQNRAFRMTVDNTSRILSRAKFDVPRQA